MSVRNYGNIPGVESVDLSASADMDVTKSMSVEAVASGTVTIACPVGLIRNSSGQLTAVKIAIDANTLVGQWGVAKATVADGENVEIVVRGLATVASGGTANQVGNVISNAGAITDAAIGATVADTCLFTSLSASTILIH